MTLASADLASCVYADAPPSLLPAEAIQASARGGGNTFTDGPGLIEVCIARAAAGEEDLRLELDGIPRQARIDRRFIEVRRQFHFQFRFGRRAVGLGHDLVIGDAQSAL